MDDRLLAAALKRLDRAHLSECFDPMRPDSRPNSKQWEIFKDIGKVQQRFVTAGNQSGKSSLAAREIAWILNDDHPFWTRPAEWGDEPLLIIIAGQDRKNMEINLWESKLAPFLDKGEWRASKQGGTLQYLTNRRTEDVILFVSHSDSSDHNRRHMQGYVANYVWLDEMPSSMIILEELQRRVDAKRGYLMATFTPKFRNDAIRRVIEAGTEPVLKQYKMSKLDNPLYADRLEEELAKLDGYPDSYRRAILYGEWYTGDSAVYEWSENMIEAPENYSTAWRHVESIDPALKSKFGYTLWAENPETSVWYLMKAEYIQGIFNPETMVERVIKHSAGYNICRRVTDYAPWFTGLAAPKGIHYMSPHDKNSRKAELIKGLQHAMSSGKIKVSPHCTLFIDEIQSCQWSETTDKIVNSSSYHVLDCAQYFVDCRPKYDPSVQNLPYHHALRVGNAKRKKQEAAAKASIRKGGRLKPLSAWGSRRRR